MKNYDLSNMVLRFYIGEENTQQRFDLMVDFLKRSGIHRVILFSAPFAETSSILPEEYYKRHTEIIRPYVGQLKEMGVEVGINVLHTNGHCFYADENEFGFDRAVTLSGEPSRGSVCMLNEKFIEHIKKQYKYYAALHPVVIFTDDDIRAISLGQFICLCPKHIEAISKKIGKEVTFEEVRSSVLSDSFEKNKIKNAFFEQIKEDIENVLTIIADSVHEISPETKIGVMTTSYPSVTADRDLKGMFERLAESKKIDRIRTGMDFYREGDHNSIPHAFSQPIIQRAFIDNPNVEIQPEVENDTYDFYQKSNSVTNLQIMWCITNGFRNLQLNLFSYDMPVFNYDEITGLFEQNMNYYNAAAELIPENHRADGIGIYAHPRAITGRRAKNGSLFFGASWYQWLNLLGLPISSEPGKADFMMLSGDDIILETDEEIDRILKKGAVMDVRAAEALVERGYGDRIGVKKIEEINEIYAGERFTDDFLNGEFKGVSNSDYIYSTLLGKDTIKKIIYDEKACSLSYYINHHKEKVCDAVARFENKKGERFIILPYEDNGFTYFTNVNHKRRRQLINGFEWIAGKKLPVCAENEKACVNINHVKNGNVITLFNLASDNVKTPRLKYTPVGTLKFVDKSGRLKRLPYDTDGEYVTVKKELNATGVLVIVDEVK